MATEVKLGQLVGGAAGRDAVHVAVVPMKAAVRLRPGCHVDRFGGTDYEPVGIVDPFLLQPVEPGQTFWLCLYPGTVTSLRHVWTHPAFEVKVPGVPSDG
jgi:hypothetical protein